MTAITNNLCGLILAGGHSKRMGQDKSLLIYRGKTQVEHSYDLLLPFCERVFISTRPDQSQQAGYAHLSQLHDLPEFSNTGPIGGILSAMTLFPAAAWLVFACDLPYITSEAIAFLIQNRNRNAFATAFTSTSDQLPEPLCSIWEAKSCDSIKEFLRRDVQCPRKMLIESNTHLIVQKDPRWLNNINNPQEYKEARLNISECK